MKFEERQQLAIQMVSILWKIAYEFSSDDTYGDVRELMENVIIADCNLELAEAMGKFEEIRCQIEADEREKLFYMEHNWKMRERDAK